MKLLLILVLLSTAIAQEFPQPRTCLAVTPLLLLNRYGRQLPFARNRFTFLDSAGISMNDIHSEYGKKDLEKLEKRGVTIIVTSKEAFKADATQRCNKTKP